MDDRDVGGVHIKYLHHCHRQLWLFAHGLRPEALNAAVRLGEAIHDVHYDRYREVDLGAAKLDHLDGDLWVHEVKSSSRPSDADQAQAVHYCRQLDHVGVSVRGAILHYPATRRTVRIPYTTEQAARADGDIAAVLDVVHLPTSPARLARPRCTGCSYIDYCWSD